MYVVANILTLYRIERPGMVSRGLETLKNMRNSVLIYSTCDVTKSVIFGSNVPGSIRMFGNVTQTKFKVQYVHETMRTII